MAGLTAARARRDRRPAPPHREAAIATAHDAGIQVRMIPATTRLAAAIAKDLGIRGRAISGAQFAELSEEEADRSTTSA